MKISRFKTNVLADSITPQISFCVNISTDELRLFNVDDFFSLEERERAFGKMMLEEISNARIKEINIPMAINLDGSIRSKNDPFDYGLTSNDAEIEYYSELNP